MVWFWISFVLHKLVLVSPLSLTLISSMAPEGKLIFSYFPYPDCFPGRKKVLISLGVQLTPTAFQVLAVISGEAAEPGAQNLVIHTVFLRGHCAASCTKPLNSSFPSSHTEVIFTQLCTAHWGPWMKEWKEVCIFKTILCLSALSKIEKKMALLSVAWKICLLWWLWQYERQTCYMPKKTHTVAGFDFYGV